MPRWLPECPSRIPQKREESNRLLKNSLKRGEGYGLINEWYVLINEAYGLINEGYWLINEGYGLINEAYGLINEAYGLINEAYGLINEAYGLINEGYGLQPVHKRSPSHRGFSPRCFSTNFWSLRLKFAQQNNCHPERPKRTGVPSDRSSSLGWGSEGSRRTRGCFSAFFR